MPMQPDKVKDYLERKILENLNQEIDVGLQAEALKAFIHLIETEDVPVDLEKLIIPFLEKEIKQTDSHIRTDVFKTLARLGVQHFDLIKPLFPDLIAEIPQKNRFRSKIVVDMLAGLAATQIPEIDGGIKRILADGPQWFDEPYLVPILEDFFQTVTRRGHTFLKKYRRGIEELLSKLPQHMDNIKKLLLEKIQDYGNFLQAEEVRKREEEERRKKLEEEKQRLIKEREELRRKQEEDRLKRKEIRDDILQKLPQETPHQAANPEEEPGDSPKFRTFTDYKLQRKEVRKTDSKENTN